MKLKELQKLLFEKKAVYINVSDELANALDRNVNYKTLENYNNDISVFFSKYLNEHRKVIVIPRLKNGSSSKPFGKPFTVILRDTNEPQQTSNEPKQTRSMEANNSFMGLNGAQIMDAFASQRENASLKSDVKKLEEKLSATEAENKKLTEENVELRQKLILYEHDKENHKPSAIDKLIEGIAANPEALTGVLGMLASRPGLNAAAPSSNNVSLSGFKGKLQQYAEEHPENYCAVYTQIIERFNTDREFEEFILSELKNTK